MSTQSGRRGPARNVGRALARALSPKLAPPKGSRRSLPLMKFETLMNFYQEATQRGGC
jgi:hypothetical protein